MRRIHLVALFAIVTAGCAPRTTADGVAKGPYLQNPTISEITVCWVTDRACKGEVRFRPVDRASIGDRFAVAKEKHSTQYHKLRLRKLQPYASYEYEVHCSGSQSGPYTFKTAAMPGQPFKFVAYGDSRTQPKVHASILACMKAFQPDFAIQTGDLVANGEVSSQWDEYWQTIREFAHDVPYYPALGNHERKGAPYYRYFDVQQEYSFDYGNAHFVALDSNRPASQFKAQEAWLRKDLMKHRDAAWRIVFFHHTPYTCVAMPARRVESAKLRARLEPIFKVCHVQLVLSGHDHNYQHHLADGIHYIVTGGGGAPLYDIKVDTPFTVTAKKAHHACEVVINGNELRLKAVQPDGVVIDTLELRQGVAAALIKKRRNGKVVVGAVDGLAEERGYREDLDLFVALFLWERNCVSDDYLGDLRPGRQALNRIGCQDAVGAGDVDFRLAAMGQKGVNGLDDDRRLALYVPRQVGDFGYSHSRVVLVAHRERRFERRDNLS